MGAEFSSLEENAQRAVKPVDILGEDTTCRPEELTAEEKELLQNTVESFETFYKRPTLENYNLIKQHEYVYRKALGQTYTFFTWAIRFKYPVEEPLTETEAMDYTLELDRLLDKRNFLNAPDLDKLWMLYYATGDAKFPDRVKQIANNPLSHIIVRSAAEWSYRSHLEQGKL